MKSFSIKSIGHPPANFVWSYGPDYMRRIGEQTAKKLCFPHDLPKMGYEMTVNRYRDDFGYLHSLYIQNISGDFYISCSSAKIDEWPSLFDVEVVG